MKCSDVITITNSSGLHGRYLNYFMQVAGYFDAAVWIEKDGRRVNAKSMLGVLSLGIIGGTPIRFIAEGFDEELAITGLTELITCFNEMDNHLDEVLTKYRKE